ncbi:MAG: response regulator [Methylocystaceae bacterium]
MARIVVVDDAAFMRLSIKRILEQNGHTVIAEGSNGQQAFELYQQHHPDLVTMDITMPDVTGIEGLKMIKGFDKSAKVIMVSAMGQEYLVREAILSGAASFIVKPFNEEKLVMTVKQLLS